MLSDDEADTLLATVATPQLDIVGKLSYGRQSARFAESTRPSWMNALPICRLNRLLDTRLEPTPTRHIPCSSVTSGTAKPSAPHKEARWGSRGME